MGSGSSETREVHCSNALGFDIEFDLTSSVLKSPRGGGGGGGGEGRVANICTRAYFS